MNSSTYLYVFSYEGTFSATFAFTAGVPRHFGEYFNTRIFPALSAILLLNGEFLREFVFSRTS